MMQDHPRSCPPGAKVGFTQFDDWTYSPVKNSVEEAQKKFKAGVPMRNAAEGEVEMYESNCIKLRLLGASVAEPTPFEVDGVSVPEGPHVVLAPRVGPTYASLKKVFPAGKDVTISGKSTLVLDCDDVVVESLDLDGVLVVKAPKGVKVVLRNVTVKSGEWSFARLEDADDKGASQAEWIKIRGFTVDKKGGVVKEFTAADAKDGTIVLEGEL